MKIEPRYIAFNGEEFKTQEECKTYESEHIESFLVGLTIEEVRAALKREPDAVGLSDAIEDLGNRIANTRRKSGELRVVRKPKTPPAPTEPQTTVEAPPITVTDPGPPFTSTLMAG